MTVKKYAPDEIASILKLHKCWLTGEPGGVRANLIGASLDGANLNGANLDGASLIGANLDGASLIGASLDGANLDGASLIGASLDGANLNRANLDGANLNRASLPKNLHIYSVTGPGSARRMTTFVVEWDIVFCGCFKGSLAEFSEKCKKTHADHVQWLAEYRAVVNFFKAMRKVTKS